MLGGTPGDHTITTLPQQDIHLPKTRQNCLPLCLLSINSSNLKICAAFNIFTCHVIASKSQKYQESYWVQLYRFVRFAYVCIRVY